MTRMTLSNTLSNHHFPDAELEYYPGFLQAPAADRLYEELLLHTPWRSDSIKVFGKVYPQPRLTAFYASHLLSYSYSSIEMEPLPFTRPLNDIKAVVEQHCEAQFNCCLLNLYRDGSDSNGWHADNEKSLGKNPVIASLSLGQPRFFHLKHRRLKDQKLKLLLEHGSLLLMKGPTQHHWVHQLPKTTKSIGPRINLTFRTIYEE